MTKALEFCVDFDRFDISEDADNQFGGGTEFYRSWYDERLGSRAFRVRNDPTIVNPHHPQYGVFTGNDDGFDHNFDLPNTQVVYTGYMGYWINGSYNRQVFHLSGGQYFGFQPDGSGNLLVRYPDGFVQTISGTGGLLFNTTEWYFFELMMWLDGNDFKFQMWLNGSPFSAVQTRVGGANGATKFRDYYWNADSITVYVTDFFCMTADNLVDLTPADVFGPVRINHVGMPDASGTHNDFVGSDGNSIDNHLLVDDDPYDPLVDPTLEHLLATTTGNKQTLTFPAVDLTGRDVTAMAVSGIFDTTGPEERTAQFLLKEGVSELGGWDFQVKPSLLKFFDIFETAADGTVWDAAHVDASELGVEIL